MTKLFVDTRNMTKPELVNFWQDMRHTATAAAIIICGSKGNNSGNNYLSAAVC